MSNEHFKLMGDWPSEEVDKQVHAVRRSRDGDQLVADTLDAANERIAKLEAKNTELREALQAIAGTGQKDAKGASKWVVDIARDALAQENSDE